MPHLSPIVPKIFGTSYMHAHSTRHNNNQILHGHQTRCEGNLTTILIVEYSNVLERWSMDNETFCKQARNSTIATHRRSLLWRFWGYDMASAEVRASLKVQRPMVMGYRGEKPPYSWQHFCIILHMHIVKDKNRVNRQSCLLQAGSMNNILQIRQRRIKGAFRKNWRWKWGLYRHRESSH